MSHEIESLMYVGQKPWHGLGKAFIEAPRTLEEAMVAAGLDWTVSTKKLYLDDKREVTAKATVRDSDNSILGVVGPSYKPLQNKAAFDFFNPFIEAGLATIESAGSLMSGKRVWVLAKIKNDVDVIKGNDTVERYVMLSNSHDGTMAVRAGFTPVRIICNNTLTMAHHNGESQLIRIKHGQNVEQNVEAVSKIMNLANNAFETTLEQYRLLANKEINSKDLEKYVKMVFKLDEDKEGAGKRLLNNIIPLFEKGRGNDMSEIKGTYWAAYNSISEYLQYEKGNDEQARLNNLWFGTSKTTLESALGIAVKLAA
jgi:phage/plasmid-like protein (TIGR03299 family)